MDINTSALNTQEALHLLELLFISRFTDEKMAKLSKQNKGGTFQLSAAGHELIGAVAAAELAAGRDWAFPYYRDQPLAIALGCDLAELFAVFMGRETKNHSGGRMMPHHFSHKELRIFCQSSVVGSQFLQAVGRSLAIKNEGKNEVVYVSGGDGATSQGDFHEALNFAAIHKLPVVFVIQNNGWAISVPLAEQTAGSDIAKIAGGYEGMAVCNVDGTAYAPLKEAFAAAVARGRAGEGPSVIVATVPRLAAHSNSDDPKKYREVTQEESKDPLLCFEEYLLDSKLVTKMQVTDIQSVAMQKVEEAALAGEKAPFPQKGSSRHFVFAPFEPPMPLVEEVEREGEKIVMMDAINHALHEEMAHDPHVVVFGQDVAHGKGGVFGITRLLTEKFGVKRCFNTPLAESTIIGLAIGLAADSICRPVVEIQFADYMWTGINQLFNEAASIHYRSRGEWEVPIVVRMPYGGYIQGGPYHSQSVEGFLAHCPGLKVVIPSNARDAKGLLKTAIRDPNPVIFLEHKALYRQQKFCARIEPSKDFLLPFGQAACVREGNDATIVCWGMMVVMAAEIAEKLSLQGISLEILDLRTIVPLDATAIYHSVKKTGRLLIAHEAPRFGGFGAEIAAQVSAEVFEYLDAPIMRIGGFESAIPYSKPLENEVLPQLADLESAIFKLLEY